MGKSTFSKEQRDYLVTRVPEFRNAQRASTVPNFLSHLYNDWIQRWPPADEPGDHLDDGDSVTSADEHEDTSRKSMIKVRSSALYLGMYLWYI